MPDYTATEHLPSDFRQAAKPEVPVIQPPKVLMPVPLDADVLAFFQSDTEPSDWRRHMNDVLRAYMEQNMKAEADFQAFMATVPGEGPSS